MNNQESQQEETRKHRENCHSILEVSSKIRYVGIINKFGRTLAGQLRKDMIPLFKPEEAKK